MDKSDTVDLVQAFGYHSKGAAIIFALLYVPLLAYFVFQAFSRPTYVYIVMLAFCAVRVGAFALRAVLISVESAGQKLGLLIADQVLFGVGFFGLLYSAYTLVLDIELVLNRPESTNPIIRLTKNRHLFRIAAVVAVFLAVASSIAIKSDGSTSHTAQVEHRVGAVIFLALTIVQVSQTLVLYLDISTYGQEKRGNKSFGARHAPTILLIASFLMLVREGFSVATVNDSVKQNTEHFWYPLIAAPEVLVALLFTTPGLVPLREEMKQRYSQNMVPLV